MSSSVMPLNKTQAGMLARLADYVELTKPADHSDGRGFGCHNGIRCKLGTT